MALAHSQDVAEILDPAYSPSTQDEKDLFIENMCDDVFDQSLLTDTGNALVCKHENDCNI